MDDRETCLELEMVTVADHIRDRVTGRKGWVVRAVFAVAPNVEPRCVDLQIRPILSPENHVGDEYAATETLKDMKKGRSWDDGETIDRVPMRGIPHYVLRLASPSNLIEKAREEYERRMRERGQFEQSEQTAILAKLVEPKMSSRVTNSTRGRPPERNLQEKLRILLDVEQSFSRGETRADIAKRHFMSESSLRDLLHWARHQIHPPLLERVRPGAKSAKLTEHARQLIAKGREDG